MSYIGTPPSNAFTSLLKQDFSTSATTGYTLDHAVNNANDIALFINFVRQEPTAGYAASGTTLTLTSATASSDDMYCVYLGQALQTVNPANVSVGTAQLIDGAVTSAKLASGAVANTPAFLVAQSSNQSISNVTNTIIQFGTEHLDTDNAFSSNRFTVPSGKGGLYLFTVALQMNGNISGAALGIRRYDSSNNQYSSGGGTADGFLNINITTNVQAFYASSTLKLVEGDYVEAMIYHNAGSTKTTYAPRTFFGGHKLIGV